MNAGTVIRSGLVASLVTMLIAVALAAAEPKPKRVATQAFMRQKLGWSQAILEELTLEKFDLVSKNAIRMGDMTQSNQWFTTRQPDYVLLTTNFQKSVDALYMAAVDKRLDTATEAYVNVTRSCVECHRLVRTEQRKTAGQPLKPKLHPEFKPILVP